MSRAVTGEVEVSVVEDEVDVVVAAYHDDAIWRLAELSPSVGADVDALLAALGQFSSDSGVPRVGLDE